MVDTVKGDESGSRPGYYERRQRIVRARFDALEQEFAGGVEHVMEQVLAVRDRTSPAFTTVLDDFTAECVGKVTTTLDDLLQELS